MFSTTTERSLESGISTVLCTGELTRATESLVRNAIAKAAAQCPAAVIVDLTSLVRADVSAAAVLARATTEAYETWGVAVLICGARPEIRRCLEPFRTFVALYEEGAQARLAVHAHVPRWVRRRFPPVPAGVAQVRSLVRGACSEWELAELRDPAALAASELASNAVLHARTDFDVLLTCTGRYLRIAVEDGSPTLPAMVPQRPSASTIMARGTGRGLRIVAAVGTHCGVTRTAGGKSVWVLIRTTPPGGDVKVCPAGHA